MKKIIATSLLGVLLTTLIIPWGPHTVMATDTVPCNTVAVSDLDVTIQVPSSLYYLTRNVSAGNEAFAVLKELDDSANANDMLNYYIANDVYVDIFPEDLQYEILVQGSKIHSSEEVKDFTQLEETDFAPYVERMRKEYEEAGIDCDCIVLDRKNEQTFLVTSTHSTLNNTSVYVLRLYTVVNGYNYYYVLQSNGKEIDATLEGLLYDIANSAVYEPVEASITESSLFMELYETVIGFGLTILILGGILFTLIHAQKKAKK
ncbi:MAG: hypothetical protein K6C69_05525 [Lachnospiraceae bacterium]|nr:hypothetical protein [Lachnospiraceae bacterium]